MDRNGHFLNFVDSEISKESEDIVLIYIVCCQFAILGHQPFDSSRLPECLYPDYTSLKRCTKVIFHGAKMEVGKGTEQKLSSFVPSAST